MSGGAVAVTICVSFWRSSPYPFSVSALISKNVDVLRYQGADAEGVWARPPEGHADRHGDRAAGHGDVVGKEEIGRASCRERGESKDGAGGRDREDRGS